MILGISPPESLMNMRGKQQSAKEPLMTVAVEQETNLYPFVLTEDQEHLRREIRDFAATEIAPNVMTWD